MMAAPPLEAGGFQDTVTWPLPAVAVTPVGGPGFRIRACGSRTAVRTTETASPPPPAVPAAVPADRPGPARMAGQLASTAARHVPATVVSQRPRGAAGRARRVAGCPGTAAGLRLLARRKGIMRSPGGEATRCQED